MQAMITHIMYLILLMCNVSEKNLHSINTELRHFKRGTGHNFNIHQWTQLILTVTDSNI